MADATASKGDVLQQGAEAKVYVGVYQGRRAIVKERFRKKYRHPELDRKLTKQRLLSEARNLARSRDVGVRTPEVYHTDPKEGKIYMEYLDGAITVKQHLLTHGVDTATHQKLLTSIGEALAKLHTRDLIHGDLTTSNMMLHPGTGADTTPQLVMIDFGLSHVSTSAEDKAVDLYVLQRALESTHPNSEALLEAILDVYRGCDGDKGKLAAVLSKLEEVRARGRKRSMLG
eukprot:m.40280 g.40280  ORF g.40280 m.40280 type:complete len:230 (+) comp14797_c0_seq1:80-769(+)